MIFLLCARSIDIADTGVIMYISMRRDALIWLIWSLKYMYVLCARCADTYLRQLSYLNHDSFFIPAVAQIARRNIAADWEPMGPAVS